MLSACKKFGYYDFYTPKILMCIKGIIKNMIESYCTKKTARYLLKAYTRLAEQ